MHRFSYKTYYLDNATNEWVYIPQVLAGVTNRETLDETLDMSVMAINGISQKEPFEPFTKFKREVLDYASGSLIDTIYRYCASDVVVQTTFGAKQLFRHNITLIEPTKELERYVCDNLTFTNPLFDENALKPREVLPLEEISPPNSTNEVTWEYISPSRYYTPLTNDNTITLFPLTATWEGSYQGIPFNSKMTTDIDSRAKVFVIKNGVKIQKKVGDAIIIKGNEYCTIRYEFDWKYDIAQQYHAYVFLEYVIASYIQSDPPVPYSITNVGNRIFSVTPTRLASEAPIFKLSEDFAKKYEKMNAPEFSFTQKTLFDASLEVGKSIQSIPYIKADPSNDKDWSTIDFQFVGGNIPYSLEDIPYSAYQDNWSCEQYCDCIDSTINNIMCSDVNKQGTLYEPYYGGSIEARVESGELTEDTVELITSMPIGKLHKVIIKGETIGTNDDYDITPFVFEKTNYDALSNYIVSERSKAFAVYYSYGQKNIKGLYYKITDAVSSALQNPAIQNIIAVVSGQNVNIPFDKLYYQIEYTPFINARLKQYKSNINSTKNRSTLIFNQQTNIPDSRAYGSNMLGTVARLGNTAPIITYLLTDYSLIPHVGQLSKNGYYVSIVELEYWEDYIKCTVTMSKDFNRLSEYVGIKSYERFYEVDPTMALDRFVNIDDFVVFSTEKKENNNSFITAYGIIKFADMFYKATQEPVSLATINNKESDGTVISSVALSASSLGFGNSIALTASYQDNYAATSQVKVEKVENVTNKTKLFGKPYQYSNVFGRIETCDITFSLTANDTNNNNYNYPDLAGVNPLGQLVQINDLQLEKDSREKINITYQMHFVSDNNNIVIGQAMTDNNSFIGANTNVPAKVVFLDKKIGAFESVIDYNAAIYIDWEEQLNGDGEKKLIDFGTFYAPIDCQAWAILDSNNNLMIGMNEAVNQGERTTAIIANFTRKK